MYKKLQPVLEKELASIKEAGLFKKERVIVTPQGADIETADGKEVINAWKNNTSCWLILSQTHHAYRWRTKSH